MLERLFSSTTEWLGTASSVMIVIVAAVSLASLLRALKDSLNENISYKVAVIGLPRSGKTTIISTIFYNILRGDRAKDVKITGEGTIRRISDYISAIRSGVNLGPTTDREVYSYRFEMRKRRAFGLYRKYDVEVADFPGEYSARLARKAKGYLTVDQIERNIRDMEGDSSDEKLRSLIFENLDAERKNGDIDGLKDESLANFRGLYDTEYQAIISSARKYVIVVDVENVFRNPSLVPNFEAKIFNSVMYLKEYSIGDKLNLSRRDVALVFSKCDLIANEANFKMLMDELSDGKINFVSIRNSIMNEEFFESKIEWIKSELSETIAVLKSNFQTCTVLPHSSYLRNNYFIEREDRLISLMLP